MWYYLIVCSMVLWYFVQHVMYSSSTTLYVVVSLNLALIWLFYPVFWHSLLYIMTYDTETWGWSMRSCKIFYEPSWSCGLVSQHLFLLTQTGIVIVRHMTISQSLFIILGHVYHVSCLSVVPFNLKSTAFNTYSSSLDQNDLISSSVYFIFNHMTVLLALCPLLNKSPCW